jgi:DNA-binding MurR/RpiR family transcriptional regulator
VIPTADLAIRSVTDSPLQLREAMNGRRLTPAQRRIAQFVSEEPQRVAMMSSPELADAVGISQPSVTRFAMALGFSGFADLRRALADELLRAGADVDRAGPPTADPVVDPAASNVAALHRSLPSAEMLLTLGSDLHGAPTLGVFGLRVAEAPARWFHFLAQKVHADVRLVSDGVGHLVDTIGDLRRRDGSWLVAFVLPEYPTEAGRYLELVQQAGVPILLITDSLECPLSQLGQVVITTKVRTGSTFDSIAAPSVIGNVLAEAMITADPPSAAERLEDFEAAADRFGLYLNP